MTGLYVQVQISKITHSMKLSQIMISLDHLLIPISMVTFDAPKRYKVKYMKQKTCNVMVHVKNAWGDVIGSARLPWEMKLPSEQLVQTSRVIWRMNDIPRPLLHYIRSKKRQLDRAFVSAKKIIAREKGTLSLREQIHENNKQIRLAEMELKTLRALISNGNDGPKQEIGQQNVRRFNCQMPANFENIILNAQQFQNLHDKLTTEQFEGLVIGMFVHAIIPKNYKLQKPLTKSVFLSTGHLIVPIAGISYSDKRGRHRVHIHLPENIKLVWNNSGALLQKITNKQLGGVCAKRLIEECAMILNACEIAPPTNEFIAQKERELRRWL